MVTEKLDKRKSKEEIEEDIKRNFRMKGLIASDIKLVKMMDKSLETGGSNIIPAYIKNDGTLSKQKSSSISSEQFKILQKYIIKEIKGISKEILSRKN